MDLSISGGSKLQRTLVAEVTEFMRKKYFSRYKTLDIHFTLSKTLSEEDGVDGICFTLETVRPREFAIDIDSTLSVQNFIKTVIHELVHVKQYACGELVDRVRGRAKVTWKGADHSKTTYSKQPWEREAYRLQELLYKEFMES